MEAALALIGEDLKNVELQFKKDLQSNVPLIRKVAEYVVSSGGKRIRPALVVFASRLYSPQVGSEAVALAAAVEMLHTASLVHDDLIDGSLLRRGLPTLNAQWTPGATVLTGTRFLDFIFDGQRLVGVKTDRGDFGCRWVVNAAGLHSDEVMHKAGIRPEFSIHPRRGEYTVLDRAEIHPPARPLTARRCIATVVTADWANWLEGFLASLVAHGECDDALRVVFVLGESAECERSARRYGAEIVRCSPRRPGGPALKSILYSVPSSLTLFVQSLTNSMSILVLLPLGWLGPRGLNALDISSVCDAAALERRRPPVVGQRLEAQLEVGQRVGVEQLAQLLLAEQLAQEVAVEGERLRASFEEQFWCEDRSTYALALDGAKQPCRIRTSTPSHINQRYCHGTPAG